MKAKVNLFELIKSSFVIYKENFLKLIMISIVFTLIKFIGYYTSEAPVLKLIFLGCEIAATIAFTYIAALSVTDRESIGYQTCGNLIQTRFFKTLGINLLAGLLILIAAIPNMIVVFNASSLKTGLILTILFLPIPMVASCFVYFSATICILRDIDKNHYFSEGSISESFALCKENFWIILSIHLLILAVLSPGIYTMYQSFKTLDVQMLEGMMNYKAFILSMLIHPFFFVMELNLFYKATGIKIYAPDRISYDGDNQ